MYHVQTAPNAFYRHFAHRSPHPAGGTGRHELTESYVPHHIGLVSGWRLELSGFLSRSRELEFDSDVGRSLEIISLEVERWLSCLDEL